MLNISEFVEGNRAHAMTIASNDEKVMRFYGSNSLFLMRISGAFSKRRVISPYLTQARCAGVAELVDALDLGSSDESRGGSSPSARTIASVGSLSIGVFLVKLASHLKLNALRLRTSNSMTLIN
jgi:hypothetical protein